MVETYIHRAISTAINEASIYFPVITVTGPRQSGKSTLLRHLFPTIPYISMENPDTRLQVRNDPRGLLDSFPGGVIIDEVQNTPELLSYIQGIVDENPSRKFYLTGSFQFSLLKNVTQSLADRTALFELLPLSLDEIADLEKEDDMDTLLYSGFYPAIWSGSTHSILLLYLYYYPNNSECDPRRTSIISSVSGSNQINKKSPSI